MCIHCLPSLNSASAHNVLHPLFSNFCCRENIRDRQKDIVFLLVWGNDTYIEKFLALLPLTCVLQPTLVHLYQTSSLLPSPLSIGASASLRLLYLLLYTEHINHIQVLGFLPFPYSSCVHSPPSVCPMDISERMQLRFLQRQLHTHYWCTIHNSQAIETAKMPHYWLMD
jgi:hypothetical protein